jgi:hypothetical protein
MINPTRPTAPAARAALSIPTARATVGAAAALAVCADLLLYNDPAGLGFSIWIALLGLSMVALVWRDERTVPMESAAWLAIALLSAAAVAWRASGALRFLDIVATVAALGLAAVTLRRAESGLFARRVADTLWTAAVVLQSVAAGVLPLVFRDALARGHAVRSEGMRGERSRAALPPALRPAVLAIVILIVFGALLRSADPIFASLLSLPAFDAGVVMSHVLVVGFFGWLTAGWARGALLPTPTIPEHEPLPFALHAADVAAILGALGVLFTLFVGAQLGWYFGGETFLRERTGLTVAAYARSGFFQLVWVVVLVVPVLVGTRAALAPGRALARRHTLLSLPVVALLGAMILSAMLRLRLYVHYYGLTLERLYPLVLMVWLAVVLVWLTVTVLRGWTRPFVAGAAISALVTLAALNIMNPDALVARVNVARAARIASDVAPLDLAHLASLSGDAASIVAGAVIAAPAGDPQRCAAARELLRQWGPDARLRERNSRVAPWRWWNAGEQSAARAVLSSDAALRAAMHASCVKKTVQR